MNAALTEPSARTKQSVSGSHSISTNVNRRSAMSMRAVPHSARNVVIKKRTMLVAAIAILGMQLRTLPAIAQCASTVLNDVEDFTFETQLVDFEHYPDGTEVPLGAADLDDEWLTWGIRISDSSLAPGARAYTSTLGIPAHSGVNALADSDADAGGHIRFQFVETQTMSDMRYVEVGLWVQTGDAGDIVEFLDGDGLPICTITTPHFGDYFIAIREPMGIAGVRVIGNGWYLVDDLQFGGPLTPPVPCTDDERGDVDGNGRWDAADISAFIDVMLDPAGATAPMHCRADIGGLESPCTPDDLVTFEDVVGFVQLILHGECNVPPSINQGAVAALQVAKDSSCPTPENSIELSATDDDDPVASLAWSLGVLPIHGVATIDALPGNVGVRVCYEPDAGQASPDSFAIGVTDPLGGADVIVVNATVSNVAPSIVEGSGVQLTVAVNSQCGDGPNSFELHATDVDDDDMLLAWEITSPAVTGSAAFVGGALGGTVRVCYAPQAGQSQSDRFDVTVYDGFGGSDSIAIDVKFVASPPEILEGAAVSMAVSKNSVCIFPENRMLLHATDPDGDGALLDWLVSGGPMTGYVEFPEGEIGETVTICYEPDLDQVQSDAFVVRVTDADGGFDEIAIDVTVSNAPPVIDQGDGPLAISVGVDSDCGSTENLVTFSATDADDLDTTLEWSIDVEPISGAVSFVDATTGKSVTVCYVPDPGQSAADQFSIRVADLFGGEDLIAISVTVSP